MAWPWKPPSRTAANRRGNPAEHCRVPQPIRRLLTELLEAAQAGRFQPTAELFNRKTQAIGRIAEELKHAIRNQVA